MPVKLPFFISPRRDGRRPPPFFWLGGVYLGWSGLTWLAQFHGTAQAPTGLGGTLASLAHVLLAGWLTGGYVAGHRMEGEQQGRLPTGTLLAMLGVGVALALLPEGAEPWRSALGSANLLAFALVLGTWLAGTLRRAAEIVPVCVVMALADIYSVLRGPTRYFAEGIAEYYRAGRRGPAPLVDYLLVKVAVPGLAAPLPVFGVADWIAVAFLACAAARFDLDQVEAGPWRPGLLAGAGGLLLAVLLAQGLGVFLPALPVITLAFLGVALARDPGVRRLVRSDWICLGVAGVVLGVLLAVGL
ncbi:hypothetical protein DESUT3_20960 [Desulfuromonas versatilis]|uniref:Uncharacterized protein n=1 Tax=Desulfuromonas versatilis TaxID=2802975 RepID=A0ABM8HWW9_9BACT|nr:hypothetical protein [Desulfuromonas versatilis]BCR05027.1 hypothetical protein DESUT3_20960 [Desulfuromonas versatilis]